MFGTCGVDRSAVLGVLVEALYGDAAIFRGSSSHQYCLRTEVSWDCLAISQIRRGLSHLLYVWSGGLPWFPPWETVLRNEMGSPPCFID